MDSSSQQAFLQIPPEPQIKTTPPTSPSKTFLILVVLIIVAVGVGGYALGISRTQRISVSQSQDVVPPATTLLTTPTQTVQMPTETPTTTLIDSIVYTGKNFTFQYPKTWKVNMVNETFGSVYNPTTGAKGGNEGVSIYYSQSLGISINTSSQSATEFVDAIQKAFSSATPITGQQGFQRKTVMVNNQQAPEYYNPQGQGTTGWYVIFSNGNTLFQFSSPANDPMLDNTYKQIISSFKFTN